LGEPLIEHGLNLRQAIFPGPLTTLITFNTGETLVQSRKTLGVPKALWLGHNGPLGGINYEKHKGPPGEIYVHIKIGHRILVQKRNFFRGRRSNNNAAGKIFRRFIRGSHQEI